MKSRVQSSPSDSPDLKVMPILFTARYVPQQAMQPPRVKYLLDTCLSPQVASSKGNNFDKGRLGWSSHLLQCGITLAERENITLYIKAYISYYILYILYTHLFPMSANFRLWRPVTRPGWLCVYGSGSSGESN